MNKEIVNKDFEETSFLYGSNAVFIEELYQIYLSNPLAVDSSWRAYFRSLPPESNITPTKSTASVIRGALPLIDDTGKDNPEKMKPNSNAANRNENKTSVTEAKVNITGELENHLRAKFMLNAYREKGHYLAKLDPLGLEETKTKEELNLNIENFGFSPDQYNQIISVGKEFEGIDKASLKELVTLFDKTYCGSIAAEFSHVENLEEQKWLYRSLENAHVHPVLSNEEKKNILKDLMEIEGFEQYLHTKFPGAKRFSVEGGSGAIMALNNAIEIAAEKNVQDIVIGMAHRGRLSTLTKVMKKPHRAVLYEFMGNPVFPRELEVAGDVKYHMGYSSDITTRKGNKTHLSLAYNPSHLEAVNPVVAGKVRASQDLIKDTERKKVLGILIHGDAAFCGQGVVAECLVMSGLEAYNVGGILHIVINNQIGFTANTYDTRPGRYATEIAKVVGAPVMHVNGDDIEEILTVTKIASEYRYKFGKDVVIDIVCYRKYGHNEGDEPMYTQAKMYNIIRDKKTPATVYANKLVTQQIIDEGYLNTLQEEFKTFLGAEYEQAKTYVPQAQWLAGAWAGYSRSDHADIATGVKKTSLQELGLKLCSVPKNFAVNPKLKKLFDQRAVLLREDKPFDWATGEQLAFASLLQENIPLRLTGQDCERGTFSHRHSVLHSQVDNTTYIPLNNLNENQALYEVADSNLSEYGVLGFEYGYSLVNPKHLVIWEAQFGDFANGAQIIFDQFIASAETKWLRLSGLVVLLPHGFEGQGPEHSSARLERFLQLAAEDNMQIVYPTTPSSLFHLLRRQLYKNSRKPLIVMTPKSLLRHKNAVSTLDEIAEGTSFSELLDETNGNLKAAQIKRMILCSGKVYYDLLEARNIKNITDMVIIRLEQLYPFPDNRVIEMLKKYNNAKEFIWCQEEPKNMGAWNFITSYLNECLKLASINNTFKYIGRPAAASPAVGYLYQHNKQQEALITEALLG